MGPCCLRQAIGCARNLLEALRRNSSEEEAREADLIRALKARTSRQIMLELPAKSCRVITPGQAEVRSQGEGRLAGHPRGGRLTCAPEDPRVSKPARQRDRWRLVARPSSRKSPAARAGPSSLSLELPSCDYWQAHRLPCRLHSARHEILKPS